MTAKDAAALFVMAFFLAVFCGWAEIIAAL